MESNSNYKILLVDDEADILEFLSYNLKKSGYSVLTASNGRDAIKIAKQHLPHLIILDVMMPEMDGIETCERIRKRYPDLPVYAFTANTESEDGSLYADYGFNGYLAKPIDAVLLEKTILKHLPDNIVMV